MIKKISKETISAIKDNAVVKLAVNAEIKMIGKSVVLTIDDKNYDWGEDEVNWMDNCVKHINKVITHHNSHKLYNIINTIFTEMDYNLTFNFGDYTLGLAETEEGYEDKWYDKSVYVIPTDAKDEDGDWDWCAATYFSIEHYFKTYADLLRGDRDIIEYITNSILDFMETDTPYPSTQGTTVTYKTEVE